MKKSNIFKSLFIVGIFSFSLCMVMAATITKSKNLSVSYSGAKASLTAKATYSTSGDMRWTYYGYSNYDVTFTSTYGITMTGASWTGSGSDSLGYHSKKFTWKSKAYELSDRNMTAKQTFTKNVTFKYTISTNKMTVTTN